jgi:protoheme IX farnesyltransferase
MTPDTKSPANSRFLAKLKAYFALTKPRVIELLLIATVPAMILAEKGMPSIWLILATLFGGALSAGSANAFNCYIDSDIDKLMGRTKNRPLVTGELTQREALVFAWVIGVLSVLWFGFLINWLSAALSLAAILFYVFVYTLGLKRRTPQNIVWGGAAGCMPVLIGWAAVTNSLTLVPVAFFMVIFFWTPPHTWALALLVKKDYARARVPMLPVVLAWLAAGAVAAIVAVPAFTASASVARVRRRAVVALAIATVSSVEPESTRIISSGLTVWFSKPSSNRPMCLASL